MNWGKLFRLLFLLYLIAGFFLYCGAGKQIQPEDQEGDETIKRLLTK